MRTILLVAVVGGGAALWGAVGLAQRPGPAIEVFKDAACGCCSKWVDHLREKGFAPTTKDVADMDAIKTQRGVPTQARSCHTAVVGGYVIEGHVPAADVQRLLKERPAGVVGLAVPGMPIGSPGMEVAGMKPQTYDVLAFDKAGKTRVFTSH